MLFFFYFYFFNSALSLPRPPQLLLAALLTDIPILQCGRGEKAFSRELGTQNRPFWVHLHWQIGKCEGQSSFWLDPARAGCLPQGWVPSPEPKAEVSLAAGPGSIVPAGTPRGWLGKRICLICPMPGDDGRWFVQPGQTALASGCNDSQ